MAVPMFHEATSIVTDLKRPLSHQQKLILIALRLYRGGLTCDELRRAIGASPSFRARTPSLRGLLCKGLVARHVYLAKPGEFFTLGPLA
jgi:hypothetical protein